MEKETITITIYTGAAKYSAENKLQDKRTIHIEATRAEAMKKVDEICTDLESSFDH